MRALARRVLGWLPADTALPVVRGPLRGMRWTLGAGPRGVLVNQLEPSQLALFLTHVRPGSVVWDIGANVGLYTLAAARRAREVVAFEPLPRNVAHLRRHLALNRLDNVRVVEAAVGRRSGDTRLALGDSPSEAHVHEAGTLVVAAIALDEWAATTGAARPDAVKIDVEGAEVDVLAGARHVFAGRPPILLGVHGEAAARGCRQWLHEAGYQVAAADGGPARMAGEWIAIAGP